MSEPVRISAVDGYALGGQLTGQGNRGPVIIINSATGVSQRYYARFAEWAADRGATTLTWDYRGMGQSRPHRLKRFEGTMRDWGQHDFEGVLRFMHREFAGRPLVAIGHSVGGQILGQAPGNTLLSRVVTVGSQLGSWQLWPGAGKLAMASLWFGVMPAVTRVMGYFPGRLGIGADLPRGVALEWARWGRSRRFFLDHGVSEAGYRQLAAPLLSFSFTDDHYAPKRAVDALHALYSAANVERRHLSPKELQTKSIGHFGFFRETFRTTLWEQLEGFLFGLGSAPHPGPLPASQGEGVSAAADGVAPRAARESPAEAARVPGSRSCSAVEADA